MTRPAGPAADTLRDGTEVAAPPAADWCRALRSPPPLSMPPGFARKASAVEVASQLQMGGRVLCASTGQWSLLDLLRSLAERMPPARWTLSTWTVGKAEIDTVAWMVAHGEILAVRWLLDRGFWSTAYATEQRLPERLIGFFGADCVVATHNHAKFATLVSPVASVSVMTSANLNANRRVELASIEEGAEVAAFLGSVVDELQARLPSRGKADPFEVHRAWAGLCHGTPASAWAAEWAAVAREPRPLLQGAVRHDDQAPGGGGNEVGDSQGRTALFTLAERIRARRVGGSDVRP
jgi:hypothetical protein